MKVLVIGSGGREHAIVWKIAQSKDVQKIYCVPGNGGIRQLAECVDIKVEDIKGLVDFAVNNKIDITIVGPEIPLVLGVVDEFRRHNLNIFGPSKSAAQLEGSKVFSKQLMWKYKIPTAKGEVFAEARHAIDYIKFHSAPIVIKADGLAAGKGVIVAKTVDEAVHAVSDIMEKRVFGDAGARLIVEECLDGEEVSILAFSDGKNVIPLVPAQDHKRVFDNDKGPNTGGMGAYSPVPVMNDKLLWKILKEVLEPTIKAMAKEGHSYQGILYAGLMLTKDGPKVLEYNVRFGDPETQAVLPRMTSDLLDPIIGTINGNISKCKISWTKQACVCIVLASGGYPDKYEKDLEISGLNSIADAMVFHAGTKLKDGKILTAGGRVLGVTALGGTVDEAVEKGYNAVSKIKFKNMHYRKDIAHHAIVSR